MALQLWDQAFILPIVRRCPDGFWWIGEIIDGVWNDNSCTNECPDCYNGGVCNEDLGECICAPGFMGETCEEICQNGFWGRECQLRKAFFYLLIVIVNDHLDAIMKISLISLHAAVKYFAYFIRMDVHVAPVIEIWTVQQDVRLDILEPVA